MTPAFAFDASHARQRADQLGLPLLIDAYGPQAALPEPAPAVLAKGFAAPLLDLGLLAATGPEAVKFLHTQLTNDVEQLLPGSAQWFGFCNAKGRLQASFLGWRADTADAPRVCLAVSLPLAETLRKRLAMFVMRSKLKLTDDSAGHCCFGLAGEAARAVVAALAGAAPEPHQVVSGDGISAVGLPAVLTALAGVEAPMPRWQLWVAQDRASAVWAQLQSQLAPAPGALWRWLEVRAGVARIVPGTWERFVPQMVNFELVGGVNFKKGCYPGQEVVARSQYLGKLKRRMFLGAIAGPAPQPGADVFASGSADPCGQVVLAAPAPEGGAELLFESQTAAVQAGQLMIEGIPIRLLSLPYALPA